MSTLSTSPSSFSHVGRHLLVSTLPLAVLCFTPYGRRFLSPRLLVTVLLPAVLLFTSFCFRSVGGYRKPDEERFGPTLLHVEEGGSEEEDDEDDGLDLRSRSENVEDVVTQMAPTSSDVEMVSDDENFIELTFPEGHCHLVREDHQGDDRDMSCSKVACGDPHLELPSPDVLVRRHGWPELLSEINDEANWIEIDATIGSIICHG